MVQLAALIACQALSEYRAPAEEMHIQRYLSANRRGLRRIVPLSIPGCGASD
jgi:hypothetical protein